MPSIFPSKRNSPLPPAASSHLLSHPVRLSSGISRRESLLKSEILLAATARTLPSTVRSASFFAASLSAGRSVRIIIIEVVHNIPLKYVFPHFSSVPASAGTASPSSVFHSASLALALYLPYFSFPLLTVFFYRGIYAERSRSMMKNSGLVPGCTVILRSRSAIMSEISAYPIFHGSWVMIDPSVVDESLRRCRVGQITVRESGSASGRRSP